MKTFKHRIQKQHTDMFYLRIEEIEAPIEQRLKVNLDLSLMIHCLEQEKKLLQKKTALKLKTKNNISFSKKSC